jgi:hypothetical protein
MADIRVVIGRIDQSNFQMEILLKTDALFSRMGERGVEANNP